MKLRRNLVALMIAAVWLASVQLGRAAENSPDLCAGTARVEIAPAELEAVNLTGQPLRRRDPLYARVLVLKDGKTAVAIVSLDLIVFASSKVVREAKAKWGWIM